MLIDAIGTLSSELKYKYRLLLSKLKSRKARLEATKCTTWYVTTDPTQETWCTIEIINKGVVKVSGSQVTAEGYSDNITPLYYEVIHFWQDMNSTPTYPVPKIDNTAPTDGYVSNVRTNSQTFFNVNSATGQFERPVKNDKRTGEGFYLRVFFDTPFGITFEDSDPIWLSEPASESTPN